VGGRPLSCTHLRRSCRCPHRSSPHFSAQLHCGQRTRRCAIARLRRQLEAAQSDVDLGIACQGSCEGFHVNPLEVYLCREMHHSPCICWSGKRSCSLSLVVR
jgi:hypothetical protein